MVANIANDQRLGFQTLDDEVSVDRLPVEGRIPEWLTGTLGRVTPAGLDTGGRHVRHWFDGLAMLHSFSFSGQRVSYANRYLRTEAYRRALDPGARQPRGFATDPCRALFKRVVSIFSPVAYDNANVNLARLADEYVAMTESPAPIVFDPRSLDTVGRGEEAPGQITTAHPHYDPGPRQLVNYATHLGPSSTYRVYTRRPGEGHRVLGELPVREPAYMHSFAMTERFVVLAEFPLVVHPLDLAFGRRSFIESFRWEPGRGTRFLVIDRATGRLRAEAGGEAFFAFHHVNAFEDGDQVLVDISAYADPSIIDGLYMNRLRAGEPIPPSELRRYRIPLRGGDARGEVLAGRPFELPRIAYGRTNGRPYRFAYGAGQRSATSVWWDQLVKIDVAGGEARTWYEKDCYPGEPVFAAEPWSTDEDAGVLLSLVLDPRRGASFLLVLDARSFTEVARAQAPHVITFGFHGQYFPSRDAR
jgi:beta,beta-carotene 9',10'-dioxygenase